MADIAEVGSLEAVSQDFDSPPSNESVSEVEYTPQAPSDFNAIGGDAYADLTWINPARLGAIKVFRGLANVPAGEWNAAQAGTVPALIAKLPAIAGVVPNTYHDADPALVNGTVYVWYVVASPN